MAELKPILLGILIPSGIFGKPRRDMTKNAHGFRNPKERNLEYEDVNIITEDNVKLHCWFIKDKIRSQRCPTVVFLHGIDGNMGMRLQFISFFQMLCKVNVLLVSYRGYAFSEGKPTEKGIKKDGQAIMKYIFGRKDIDTKKIFIFGTSFGGAVGIYCASLQQYEPAGMILENTFTALDHIFDRFLKIKCLRYLVSKNHWRSVSIIHKVRCPIFTITGMKDKLVPPSHSAQLRDAAINSKFKMKSEHEKGTHKSLWAENYDQYFKKIKEFIHKSLEIINKENSDSTKLNDNSKEIMIPMLNEMKSKPSMVKLEPKD